MTADIQHSTGPGLSPTQHRMSSSGSMTRSVSFHSLPTTTDVHENGTWHAKSLPLDIPGISPSHTRPKRRRHPYLASVSLPTNGRSGALSISLLEQVRLESDVGDGSSRSGLKQHHGSWTVSSARNATSGGVKSSLSTWKSSSVPSSASMSSCDSREGAEEKSGVAFAAPGVDFPKKKPTTTHVQSQMSALSAALRGCHLEREGSSALEAAVPSRADGHVGLGRNLTRSGNPVLESGSDDKDIDVREVKPVPISLAEREEHSSPSSRSSWTYNSTDDCPSLTDAESLHIVSQAEQRRAVLERLMEHIYATLAINHGKGDGGASTSFTPSSVTSAQSVSEQNTRSSGKGGRCKRRPSQNDSDDSGGSDDDEEERRRHMPKRSKHKKTETRMLACPFFKRNPQRYQRERSCVGPGWETMHRLKEHLYRCHTLPIHCLRCHGVFPSQDALRAHSLSEAPCQRRHPENLTEEQLEGIGLDQERQLRSRKRTTKKEEDKWRDAYKICFPDETIMPSPYYEIPTLSESAASGSSELTQYEDFVQAELPRRVRSALNEWLDREMIPLEERLRPQLADMVRDIQLSLLEEFRTRDIGTTSAFSLPVSPPAIPQADDVHKSPEEGDGEFSNGLDFGEACVADTTSDLCAAGIHCAGVSAPYLPKELCQVDESPEDHASFPSQMPFFDAWEMNQPNEIAFFTEAGEPVDTSWTRFDRESGGTGRGGRDWASLWDNKTYGSGLHRFTWVPEREL